MAYVGRGGDKMAWGLQWAGLVPVGWICCDLGSHVGGFVDALLQAGAAKVYAVDTCYGTFAWTLRNDPRVVLKERANALHVELPEKVRLATADVGWTKQERSLPKALSLAESGGYVLSLMKPQYEALPEETIRGKGKVRDDALPAICDRVTRLLETLGQPFRGPARTPFLGGKGKNPEYFILIGPIG
ncbi:MAG: TlyA family rRNA (cytidine-2'-O)-methyltransferase [Planctomycetota bacterium]|jgi:23S rRNA (cytidine1920-2'-O)/16S rRNA (cytidine1409-2'-O)-methyltransferase|nr:TlyA family rRNA (cytidine-2'-O)-methyltransferase [Planctomycetota bacterium]